MVSIHNPPHIECLYILWLQVLLQSVVLGWWAVD
jgi:hypothetical protein